jgi:glycine betaine/choline ABC-type transport system substrate-binding protein
MKRLSLLGLILVLLLAGLAGCQTEEKKVIIASKPHSEQYILAEMLTQLIETHTDITVEQKLGIGGGTANIQPAMLAGEIDIYPEYSGTGWLFILKQELINDPDELYAAVTEQYKSEFDIVWLDRYGFNNTYALAVAGSIAEEFQLETYSDLVDKSPMLTFGAEYDFYEREDGYPGLEAVYGFDFMEKKELDIGLKYEAIGSGEIDVVNAFSTDGLLKEYDLKVLKDDQNFFPSYQAATLIRQETLDQYPELKDVLNKLAGQISDDEMIEMNYQVEKENLDPKDVARKFLEDKGLI